MISLTTETIGTEDVLLMLAEPNAGEPFRVSFQYETSRDESVGGIESRRPKRSVPRLGVSYRFTANETDLEILRNLEGSLGSSRVAIPFWPDWSGLNVAGLLTPQVTAGWDAGYTNIDIAESAGTPDGAYTAPLIIGRLQRKEHGYFEVYGAEVEITLLEDSPWAWRLDIAAAGLSTFTFEPDWVSEPSESTRDLLDLEQIGDGRESSVDGSTVTKWAQKASFTLTRAQINDFLGWFKKHRGGFGAFAMESFFDVGTDTAAAPLNYNGSGGRGYMRFDSDTLQVDFWFDEVAQVECGFEQVLDTTTEQGDSYARLFQIWSEADDADVAYLTSNEYPITYDGETYQPARIRLESFKSSLQLENDIAEITFHTDDIPQIAPVLRHETDIPVKCKVLHAAIEEDPVTATILTFGTAGAWKLRGERGSFSVRPFHGLLSRKIPRFQLSRTCNYSLFDGGCGLNKANFKAVGKYNAQFGGSTIRIVDLTTTPAGIAANWFAGGWVEVGTGIDKQVRLVRESAYYASGDGWGDAYGSAAVIHLVLQRPIRTDIASAGAAATAYAGCDGSFSTCGTKFSNGGKFGGAPFAPSYIETRPRGFQGGGGK